MQFAFLLALCFVLLSGPTTTTGVYGECSNQTCAHCPEPSECCLGSVLEETSSAHIGNVQASPTYQHLAQGSDTDSFTFSLSSDDMMKGLFHVSESGSNAGQVTTAQEIDREEVGDCLTFTVDIQGNNAGIAQFTVVIEDANDNSPTFDPDEYTFTFDETDEVDCLGDLQATDKDIGSNGAIHYTIQSGNIVDGLDYFEIRVGENGVPCVWNLLPLDRDRAPLNPQGKDQPVNFTLEIQAADEGTEHHTATALVHISVEDINDETPKFITIFTEPIIVAENTPVNSVVETFHAVDLDEGSNAKIVYALSLNPEFAINETSGQLYVLAELKENMNYELKVTASDCCGNSNETSLTISVTDSNEPGELILKENLVIAENETNATVLQVIFTDEDSSMENRGFNCTISEGSNNFTTAVALLDNNAFCDVIVKGSLDYETARALSFVVEFYEYGTPFINRSRNFTVNITDVNDEKPQLVNHTFSFLETNEAKVAILRLAESTFDLDSNENGEIAGYELVIVTNGTNVLTENFEISPTSGLVDSNMAIDRETLGDRLYFTVRVTDKGSPPMFADLNFTVIVLDKNDNPPKFIPDKYFFSVPEESDTGYLVGSVSAYDPDAGNNGTVVYSLKGSDLFNISSDSGLIFVQGRLDYEQSNEDSLVVQVLAKDSGVKPMESQPPANVTIRVTDINDNLPVFEGTLDNNTITFTVFLSVGVGDEVGKLNATDRDSEQQFKDVLYALSPSDYFEIAPATGVITVKQSLDSAGDQQLVVFAYNPSDVDLKASLDVTIIVISDTRTLSSIVFIIAAPIVAICVLLVVAITVLLCFIVWFKKRSGKVTLSTLEEIDGRPQSPKGILQHVPSMSRPSVVERGVKFKSEVEEMLFDQKQSIMSSASVQRTSTVNFGSSDDSTQTPPRQHADHRGGEHPVPTPQQAAGVVTTAVVNMNGDISSSSTTTMAASAAAAHHGYDPTSSHTRQRSPIIDYSPYTENFAGAGNPLLYHHHHHSHHHPSHHSGNSDEEDESMLSDMASDRNAPLPRFNMAAAATMAAAANSTTDHTHAATSFMYQTPRPTYQQNPTNSLSATLTPSSQNGSIGLSHTLNSSVSRMEPIRERAPQRQFMPNAYGHDEDSDSHGRPYSFSSDGDTSCASSELDDVLNFDPANEEPPPIYNLTATDSYYGTGYDDTEL